MINIDENEDTVGTKAEFTKILNRGKRLQNRMDEAMGDDAWTRLHGPNERPKSYVPPFLKDNKPKQPADFQQKEQQRMDNLYSIEIDAALDRAKPKGIDKAAPSQNRVTFLQDEDRQEPDVN